MAQPNPEIKYFSKQRASGWLALPWFCIDKPFKNINHEKFN